MALLLELRTCQAASSPCLTALVCQKHHGTAHPEQHIGDEHGALCALVHVLWDTEQATNSSRAATMTAAHSGQCWTYQLLRKLYEQGKHWQVSDTHVCMLGTTGANAGDAAAGMWYQWPEKALSHS
jgi:hypothetical protein